MRTKLKFFLIFSISMFLLIAAWIAWETKAGDNNSYVWHGDITRDKLAEFRDKLEKRSDLTGIEFRNSTGAKKAAGILITEIEGDIKNRKLATYVRGYCASACADAFLLGTTRTMYPSYLGMPTQLALHPATALGERNSGLTDVVNRKIVAASGGKFPLELLDRMYEISGKSGMLSIYATPHKTSRGTAHVVLCRGDEKPSECEPIPGFTPEALGIQLAE